MTTYSNNDVGDISLSGKHLFKTSEKQTVLAQRLIINVLLRLWVLILCSNVLYTIMAVFNVVVPEWLKVKGVQCWFSAVPLTC